jgi:Zn-dependent protease
VLPEPGRTQLDVQWRMFGVSVRVTLWFWLVTVILGWSWTEQEHGFRYLLLWVACVFVSILVHELGHVFMGRLFGSDGHIVLWGLGGLAVGSSAVPRRWQRILVYLAGPAAQFVIYGLIEAYLTYTPRASLRELPFYVLVALVQLRMINLYWPLLNLLPIWPLDGGQTSREIFDWLMPRGGIRASLILSIAVAGLIAINSFFSTDDHSLIPYLYTGGRYTALLFLLLALNNFQDLQTLPSRPGSWHEERAPWEQDPDYWKR